MLPGASQPEHGKRTDLTIPACLQSTFHRWISEDREAPGLPPPPGTGICCHSRHLQCQSRKQELSSQLYSQYPQARQERSVCRHRCTAQIIQRPANRCPTRLAPWPGMLLAHSSSPCRKPSPLPTHTPSVPSSVEDLKSAVAILGAWESGVWYGGPQPCILDW